MCSNAAAATCKDSWLLRLICDDFSLDFSVGVRPMRATRSWSSCPPALLGPNSQGFTMGRALVVQKENGKKKAISKDDESGPSSGDGNATRSTATRSKAQHISQEGQGKGKKGHKQNPKQSKRATDNEGRAEPSTSTISAGHRDEPPKTNTRKRKSSNHEDREVEVPCPGGFNFRGAVQKLYEITDLLSLRFGSSVFSLIANAGFTGITMVKLQSLRKDLLEWLCKGYGKETKGWTMSDGRKLSVCADDVVRIYGLPKGPIDIDQNYNIKKKDVEKFRKKMGIHVSRKNHISFADLEERLRHIEEERKFVKLYVLYAIAGHVANELLHGLDRYVPHTYAYGDMHLLLVNYMDFCVGTAGLAKDMPTCSAWTVDRVNAVVERILEAGDFSNTHPPNHSNDRENYPSAYVLEIPDLKSMRSWPENKLLEDHQFHKNLIYCDTKIIQSHRSYLNMVETELHRRGVDLHVDGNPSETPFEANNDNVEGNPPETPFSSNDQVFNDTGHHRTDSNSKEVKYMRIRKPSQLLKSPFALRTNQNHGLTDEQMKMVSFIWSTFDVEGLTGEVLYDGNVGLTISDIQTCKARHKLRSQDVTSLDRGHARRSVHAIENLPYFKQSGLSLQQVIGSCEFFFFPICGEDHYWIYCINVPNKRFELLNSIQPSEKKFEDQLMPLGKKVISPWREFLQDQKIMEGDKFGWHLSSVPQQPDTTSCGIFIAYLMEHWVGHLPPETISMWESGKNITQMRALLVGRLLL